MIISEFAGYCLIAYSNDLSSKLVIRWFWERTVCCLSAVPRVSLEYISPVWGIVTSVHFGIFTLNTRIRPRTYEYCRKWSQLFIAGRTSHYNFTKHDEKSAPCWVLRPFATSATLRQLSNSVRVESPAGKERERTLASLAKTKLQNWWKSPY